MTDLERRMAWPGAKDAILQASWVEMADWPDALTPDQIGALHARKDDGSSNRAVRDELAGFLQDEIDQGRIDALTVTQVSSRDMGIVSFWDTEKPPVTFQVPAIAVSDCARLLVGVEVGKYLKAWLAPYHEHQESGSEEKEADTQTPMRLGAILNLLEFKYPALKYDFNRAEDWIKECSTGKRGEYYLEKVKAGCAKKWGDGERAYGSGSVVTHKLKG